MGATVLGVEKLKIESNPFDSGLGNGRMGRPLRQTLGEVIRQIGIETPVVVVFGSPGTGKTLLAKTAKRACEDMGLSVRRIARGDVIDVAAGQRSDVLMVDEADSIPDSMLHTLLFEADKRPATTTVLLCLPASVRRFSTVIGAFFIELTRLSQSDTRAYIQERATQAGFADLFTPAALDLIVDASRGVPRTLWSIAGLAYFAAASSGASQISQKNVADAAASQMAHPETPEAAPPTVPPVKLVSETPVRIAAVPPVPDPPRASENIAVFPGAANPNLGPARRLTSAEAPKPQMPPPPVVRPQEPIARNTTAADMPTLATILRRLEPIAPEAMKQIQAAPDHSASRHSELPIDRRKVGNVAPIPIAHSEPTAFHVRDEQPVFADASAAQAASAAPPAFARANANTETVATQRPLISTGGAVAFAAALVAAVALAIYVPSMLQNGKPAVAASAANPVKIAPATPAPSAAPTAPIDGLRAAEQAPGNGGAARRAANQSTPSNPTTSQASNSSRPTKAGQRSRRTRAERIPEDALPVTTRAERIPEVTPVTTRAVRLPDAAPLAGPVDNNIVNAAPVQSNAVRGIANPSISAEAPLTPVKSFADYAKEAAAQVGAPTTRNADANDAAVRQTAQAKAAAEAKAEREERERQRRNFTGSSQFRFYRGPF